MCAERQIKYYILATCLLHAYGVPFTSRMVRITAVAKEAQELVKLEATVLSRDKTITMLREQLSSFACNSPAERFGEVNPTSPSAHRPALPNERWAKVSSSFKVTKVRPRSNQH